MTVALARRQGLGQEDLNRQANQQTSAPRPHAINHRLASEATDAVKGLA